MASIYRIVNAINCIRLTSSNSSTATATTRAFVKYFTANKSISSSTAAAASVLFCASSGNNHRSTASGLGNGIIYNSCQNRLQSKNLGTLRQQQQFRNFSSLQIQLQMQPSRLVHHNTMAPLKNRRYISSKQITKNMTLYTNSPFEGDVDQSTLEIKKPSGNPLVLIMAWLMAKPKHLKKYAEIYTEIGFDVMVVHITPWQLLWPVKGSQIVAAETLKFLENNKHYSPMVMHGFSVGAYQFGEMMLQMARDMNRYSEILDRFVCQIWDSAADITEIPVGVPKSIFPRNPRMQSALRNYTLYHLKTFHNQATVHYMRSSQMFHSTLLKKPALFFVADNDLIGPPASNHRVRENWERANVSVNFKCWEKSLHASHLIKHRDEYLTLLFKHLEINGALESVGIKSRAKL